MAQRVIEFNPVSRITTDAVGEPGSRTFFLQARKGSRLITMLCEKEQVRALGLALQEMLEDLRTRHPKGARFMRLEMDMSLEDPVVPDFRVEQMGLGYDEDNDLIVLVVKELVLDSGESDPEVEGEGDGEDATVARLFGTRAQMDALSRQAADVVARGRPICPLCGKPMDAEGNVQGFCPRRNGHADEIVFA